MPGHEMGGASARTSDEVSAARDGVEVPSEFCPKTVGMFRAGRTWRVLQLGCCGTSVRSEGPSADSPTLVGVGKGERPAEPADESSGCEEEEEVGVGRRWRGVRSVHFACCGGRSLDASP